MTQHEIKSSETLSLHFAHLHKAHTEAKIRLYGVLWLLVEQEIISQDRAMELAKHSLQDMISECLKYREES